MNVLEAIPDYGLREPTLVDACELNPKNYIDEIIPNLSQTCSIFCSSKNQHIRFLCLMSEGKIRFLIPVDGETIKLIRNTKDFAVISCSFVFLLLVLMLQIKRGLKMSLAIQKTIEICINWIENNSVT